MCQDIPGARWRLKYLGHNPETVTDVTHYKIRLSGDFHSGVVENSVLLGYDCCVTGQSVLDVPKVHSAFIFKDLGSEKCQKLITL